MDKNFFDFLSKADQDLLKSKARHRRYQDGDVILEQGDDNASLYLIVKGDVSVVTRMLDHTFEIEQLRENDLFGDMSFVDTDSVSTDILAKGDVSIDVITKEDVEQLITGDPLFYGRFYQALAKLLSWRLRKMNAQLEGAAFEETD